MQQVVLECWRGSGHSGLRVARVGWGVKKTEAMDDGAKACVLAGETVWAREAGFSAALLTMRLRAAPVEMTGVGFVGERKATAKTKADPAAGMTSKKGNCKSKSNGKRKDNGKVKGKGKGKGTKYVRVGLDGSVLDSTHPHFACRRVTMRLLRTMCVLASMLSCVVVEGQSASSDEERGKAWWAHVQYLADDSMQGRLTGSEEYLKAAAYVVEKFKSYGLQPAGVNGGFYQPVKFDVQRVLADKSSMSLVVDGKTEPLVLGTDAILGSRSAQVGKVDAPLVFIGYGLHLPEAKYDDFNSAEVPMSELKGKMVVYINGGPADLPGPLKSYARTAPFAKALRDAGAVGAISIPTPKSMDFGWQRVASGASQPGMRLAATPDAAAVAAKHPALADDHGAMFGATFNPAEAEKLFAGTGHTFAELLALADAQKPLPRFALNKRVTATVVGEHSQVESPNIVVMLKGSDPVLARRSM